MVAGLIIDEFALLKEKNYRRDQDMKNLCFVCGIERDKLEKLSVGYQGHYKKEHNMWNYVYYYAYLRDKNCTEYTGTESYVADLIQNLDLEWLPIKRYYCYF